MFAWEFYNGIHEFTRCDCQPFPLPLAPSQILFICLRNTTCWPKCIWGGEWGPGSLRFWKIKGSHTSWGVLNLSLISSVLGTVLSVTWMMKKKLLRSFYKQNVPQVKGQKAHTYLCICIPERIEKSKGCIPNSYREELWIEEWDQGIDKGRTLLVHLDSLALFKFFNDIYSCITCTIL